MHLDTLAVEIGERRDKFSVHFGFLYFKVTLELIAVDISLHLA